MKISRRTRGLLLVLLFAFAFAFSAAGTIATADLYCNCDVWCGPQNEFVLGHKYTPPFGCALDVLHCDDCVGN